MDPSRKKTMAQRSNVQIDNGRQEAWSTIKGRQREKEKTQRERNEFDTKESVVCKNLFSLSINWWSNDIVLEIAKANGEGGNERVILILILIMIADIPVNETLCLWVCLSVCLSVRLFKYLLKHSIQVVKNTWLFLSL